MIRTRQEEGIEAAKKKGKHLGRPPIQKPDNWEEVLAEWRAGNITTQEAMQITGLKKSSFYKLITMSQES